MSTSLIRRALAAVLGSNVVYTLYPVIGTGASVGATVTQGAANTFGADADIVAAAAITTPYWFCNAMVNTSNSAETFVVQIRSGTGTHVYAFRINPTAVTLNLGPFAPPYPVALVASAALIARCAGPTGAKTIQVSCIVATGL